MGGSGFSGEWFWQAGSRLWGLTHNSAAQRLVVSLGRCGLLGLRRWFPAETWQRSPCYKLYMIHLRSCSPGALAKTFNPIPETSSPQTLLANHGLHEVFGG